MTIEKLHLGAIALVAGALLYPQFAEAHGVVGDRFFPATIATDDPFAADELALPTVALGNHEEEYDFEYTKTIFPHIAISFAGGYIDSKYTGYVIQPDASFATSTLANSCQ